MKYLLGLIACPFIIIGQVVAFQSLPMIRDSIVEAEKEIQELEGHQTRAAQQQRYHENRAKFFSLKVTEIEAAKAERKQFLSFQQLELHNRNMYYQENSEENPQEQATESSAGEVKTQSATIAQPGQKPFNLEHLAWSVAGAETNHCTKGYGKSYNNCFGIKNGGTAPCPKVGINRMCIYENPEDSYEAFKKIRSTRYKGMPDMNKANKWTGKDNAGTWLSNVNWYYYNH